MWSVYLIWIQSFKAPFIQCSTFAASNPWVCTSTQSFCSVSRLRCQLSIITRRPWLCMVSRVFPHTLVSLCSKTYTARLPLPLPPLPLSPADCRFYHIWSFTAPCLTGFQDHFLPALLLAASCSVGTHVNSGIG